MNQLIVRSNSDTHRPLPWGVRRLANSGSILRFRTSAALFVIKAPVPHHMVRAFPGVAGLAGDRRNGIHQRHGLIGVRSVRRDGIDDQGTP